MRVFTATVDDPGKFVRARDEAQNLAQWLARMTLSFEESRKDSMDTSLSWNGATKVISTPEIAANVTLQLQLPDLILQFSENGEPVPHAMEVEGKSSAEIEAWLLVEMFHRGFDRDRFDKDLPYRWLKMMTGDEAKYSPGDVSAELQILTSYLEQAAMILQLVGEGVERAYGGSLLRKTPLSGAVSDLLAFGPEKFDLCCSFRQFRTGQSHVIHVGFTAGDSNDPIPRFFIYLTSAEHQPSSGYNFILPINQIKDREMSSNQVVSVLTERIAEALVSER
jgi:hypothetical protein